MTQSTLVPRFANMPSELIERFVCDDLDIDDKARVEAAVAASAELRTYVEERRRDRDAFFATHPFAPIRARIETRKPRRIAMLGWAMSVASAAALASVIVVPAIEKPAVGVRGGLATSVALRRDGEVLPLRDGMALVPGDQLR